MTATLFGDRRDPHDRAQCVIGSVGQRLRGFTEHPGGNPSPDPWHGADDSDVRMLTLVPSGRLLAFQRVEQVLEMPRGVATLRDREGQARQEQRDVAADGLDHARRGEDRRLVHDAWTAAASRRRTRAARKRQSICRTESRC